MTDDLIFCDATHLADLVRSRKVSSVDVVQAHLDRIAAVDPKISAVVALAADAMRQAEEADRAVQRGAELGPLDLIARESSGNLTLAPGSVVRRPERTSVEPSIRCKSRLPHLHPAQFVGSNPPHPKGALTD